MDGHSSHINLAVSDFCRDHGIILYCFPAHSSHILQPLDISVFGPTKKEWNRQIDHFKRKYNVAMTKGHFFQVFDSAWKIATKPENAKSGFKSAGLVPYNPNAVDYRKVIDGNVVKSYKKRSTEMNVDEREKLGMTRCLAIIQEVVGPQDMAIFQKRYDKEYDLSDNSNHGKLWKIFKNIKDAISGKQRNDTLEDEESENASQLNSSLTTHPCSIPSSSFNSATAPSQLAPPISLTPLHASSKSDPSSEITLSVCSSFPQSAAARDFTSGPVSSQVSPSTSFTLPPVSSINVSSSSSLTPPRECSQSVPSTSFASSLAPPQSVVTTGSASAPPFFQSVPSTSFLCSSPNASDNRTHYTSFDFSPFKNYLKISEDLVIGKKSAKLKPKVPPAISGSDYRKSLMIVQDKKKKEIEDKEKRKLDRESKKLQKSQGKAKASKRKRKESSEEEQDDDDISDHNIVYDDSSDCELEEETNICHACFGGEQWEENDKWVGCNHCSRWFHKACISNEMENMSPEDIINYNLKCKVCKTKQKDAKFSTNFESN